MKRFSSLFWGILVIGIVALLIVNQRPVATPLPTPVATQAAVAIVPVYFSQNARLFVEVNGQSKVDATFIVQVVQDKSGQELQYVHALAIGETKDFVYFATDPRNTYGIHMYGKSGLGASITINGEHSNLIGEVTVTSDTIIVNAKSESGKVIQMIYKVVGIDPEMTIEPEMRLVPTDAPKV